MKANKSMWIKIKDWFKRTFSKKKPIKKNKAQTKTYKCVDCGKVLISDKHLDLDFYWIEKAGMYCVKDYEKGLKMNDPVITAHFNRYRNWGNKKL